MGRPKKSVPAHVEPEKESQEIPEEEPEVEEEEATGPGDVNQAELVRKAIAAGHEKPKTGVPYIKDEFGVDIDPKYYSVAKSQLKKREAKSSFAPEPAKRGPKPKAAAPAPAAMAPAAPAPKAATAVLNGDIMDDLTAVKALVNKLGAEQVRKIVGLFE